MPRSYYRVRLGEGGKNADECFAGGFIGTDFRVRQDLSQSLSDNWQSFNREFIPVVMRATPGKTRIGAGLNCGALWTVSKGAMIGDLMSRVTKSGMGVTLGSFVKGADRGTFFCFLC